MTVGSTDGGIMPYIDNVIFHIFSLNFDYSGDC